MPCWREEIARIMMGSVASLALLCAGESSLSAAAWCSWAKKNAHLLQKDA